jgi:type IV pilus biogenesis protein CpaD/CtpE
MQKLNLAQGFKLVLLALLLAALAACGRDNIKEGTSDATVSPNQYDLVVRADKDGQFDLDSATVDTQTLRDHIRYRNENGQPVHSILLKPGEKQKVTNAQVAGLAGISRDLKIESYVLDNDGKLKVIQIADDGKK